jgi:hypothetical protein
MRLFQPSVLKKYRQLQDGLIVQKACKKYVKYFHNTTIKVNIRNSKGEQFQEGFLRVLFVEIDWIDVVEDYKIQAQNIKQQICKTDKGIDSMAYGLYEMSEEEISIV